MKAAVKAAAALVLALALVLVVLVVAMRLTRPALVAQVVAVVVGVAA